MCGGWGGGGESIKLTAESSCIIKHALWPMARVSDHRLDQGREDKTLFHDGNT